jgi:DNA-binding transcriptional MocR family regulator
MPDGRPSRGMRLSVASVDEAEITRGVEALGRVVRARAARAPGDGRTAGMHL